MLEPSRLLLLMHKPCTRTHIFQLDTFNFSLSLACGLCRSLCSYAYRSKYYPTKWIFEQLFLFKFLKNKGVKIVSINPRIDRVYLFASSYYQYWYIPNVGLKEVVKIKKCGCKCIWFLSCLALPPEQSALEHISSTVLSFYYFLN